MDLIDFIFESNKAENSEELINSFLKFLSGFGINRFMMAGMSHDSTSDKEKNLRPVNYPEEWLNHYMASHYVDYDPVYQKALKTTMPFTWEEVEKENISDKALQVMNEAKEFNLCCGIGITIHQPFGKITGIGFAGSEKGVRWDKDALSLIHAASHQLIVASSDLLNANSPCNEDINLTNREREVLHWIACGKTKKDTADILSVSESCIKRHCENIFIKLKVNNIPFAVTKALRMGLINPF